MIIGSCPLNICFIASILELRRLKIEKGKWLHRFTNLLVAETLLRWVLRTQSSGIFFGSMAANSVQREIIISPRPASDLRMWESALEGVKCPTNVYPPGFKFKSTFQRTP